jgi:hypothetical protein
MALCGCKLLLYCDLHFPSLKKKLSMATAGTELASKSQSLISQGTDCSDLDAQLPEMKM